MLVIPKIKKKLFFFISLVLTFSSLLAINFPVGPTGNRIVEKDDTAQFFLDLLREDDPYLTARALKYIEENWQEGYEIMLLEATYFARSKRHSNKLLQILQQKTGKKFGLDYDKWFQWIWKKEAAYPAEYFEYKSKLHRLIDPKFGKYFLNRSQQSTIRLDEVRWGGVLQDGIPPLRSPKMIRPLEATYLKDSAIVFGIEVNGDARAYPKQILAWHEMFVDEVGGIPVAGVYCTLCGTVVLYKTEHNGVNHQMGTSGFLYRSNKLMYDKATQSLWSTLEGEPVIGPLVGKGIRLDYLSVVTTTWGEWKKRHPDTKVLSLDTGHRRDYREGVAYRDYFATDDLMFTVPEIDKSLKNKDEILVIRLPEDPDENLAISSRFLKRKPIYKNSIGKTPFTVFTDKSGAHRVFKTNTIEFLEYDGNRTAKDSKGNKWTVKENSLEGPDGKILERFHSFNAFWFGYKAAFPDVTLIK
ncbi:DUF3179 domain-containing protein [Flagellimonas meridianipacifica]|uniref:Uncharacterized protein DUF3179 n=1 Tax=Flagellimonas meridianipacifica TaxID=1080225 RepID=A0A2T0MB08_9FLAO|nr:DUF3179 domain-containing protein [Allomuricauda pacifica]PRX54690.1 uncharacterized protein DUF3179 [Allomuricauda pacifica]